MYKVTRMVRGQPVEYWQSTQRVGGKVKTIYHGPVNPKRRKLDMRGLLAAVAGMGINAAMGRLGPPGGYGKQPTKFRPVDPRTFEKMTDTERAIELRRREWQREDDDRLAEARLYRSPAAQEWKVYFNQREQSDRKARKARETVAMAEWKVSLQSQYRWGSNYYPSRESAIESHDRLTSHYTKEADRCWSADYVLANPTWAIDQQHNARQGRDSKASADAMRDGAPSQSTPEAPDTAPAGEGKDGGEGEE